MTNRLLLICWFLVATICFVYSYGFVDFNLTLSTHPSVIDFITWTQSLAMFDRPASLKFYLGVVTALYSLYLVSLRADAPKTFPWKPILLLATIFALSYPMLSSDVFKYLFTGKIIAYYHANPYLFPPQYFEGDLWLRFMRWIHTVTPYGPVFSALSVPYYIVGLGKFVPILYLYKLSQVAWYALSVWSLGKLSHSVKAQLFFALNPLVLMEWLVNAHNDAIMLALLLFSLYLLSLNKRISSTLALALSVGIKFVTVIALPLVLFPKKFTLRQISLYLLVSSAVIPLLYHYSYQYQPWYVTWLVPFAATLGAPSVMWLVSAYTLGSFLRYLPFIETGLWAATPLQFAIYSFFPIMIALLLLLVFRLAGRNHQ